MNNYLKILQLEKQLLEESDNLHWSKWIDKDIQDWKTKQSTNHHRQSFGGMGSINDISIGENDKNGAWKENLFQLLKSMSWTFATKNKIEFPKISIQQFEGIICRKCEYSEISEYSHFLQIIPSNCWILIFGNSILFFVANVQLIDFNNWNKFSFQAPFLSFSPIEISFIEPIPPND